MATTKTLMQYNIVYTWYLNVIIQVLCFAGGGWGGNTTVGGRRAGPYMHVIAYIIIYTHIIYYHILYIYIYINTIYTFLYK